ncbi:MAG: DUF4012 domain-containing protein [Actinomycetota bacterium]
MQTSEEPIPDRTPNAPPRRGGRRLLWVVVATLVVALLVELGMAGISAIGVRRNLLEGRDALERGRSELIDGDAAAAQVEFDRSNEAFRRGVDGTKSLWLSLAGSIPFVGNTPDAVRAIAEAGFQTSEAAFRLATAVADLPGGLGALAPTAAGISIDRLAGLTEAAARADELTGQALRTLEAAPTGFVLGPVDSVRADAQAQLATLHRQIRAGSLILDGLPSFLGADGPRHYLFGASNPAELRGTGGLIGAFAILTMDRGRLSFSEFRPIQSLPRPDVSDVPSPSQEYSDNFDFYRTGLGLWVNTNMTPDFPLAADALWLTYEAATGEDVDGVMLADPFALKALMHVTDPVEVGATGVELTDRNIVRFVSNEAYALFETNEQRKLVLGRVAQAVLSGFLAQGGDPQAKVRALLKAFDDGHVLAWTTDPEMQRGLAMTTVGGAFHPAGTDAISVVTNSASGTKLDFYQRRTVSYDVQLGGGGTARSSLTVDLFNDSPTSGFPHYVIGPYKRFSTQAGENVAVIDMYCDVGCALENATRDGEPVDLTHYRLGGYRYFEDYVRTPSGETSSVTAYLVLTQAWDGDDRGGTYRLSFVGQTTIEPTQLRVSIAAPEGMRFTSFAGPLSRDGDRVVYEGTPSGDLELRASFAPSLPVRMWRSLIRLVS